MVKFKRDGINVWPYCDSCGCRLRLSNTSHYSEIMLSHFGMHPDKDARGCTCSNRYMSTIVRRERVEYFLDA